MNAKSADNSATSLFAYAKDFLSGFTFLLTQNNVSYALSQLLIPATAPEAFLTFASPSSLLGLFKCFLSFKQVFSSKSLSFEKDLISTKREFSEFVLSVSHS